MVKKEPPAGGKELWKSFIDMHDDLELLESGKCRCKLTGHEMKPIKEVVEAHLNGKRYKKEKAKAMAEKFDFSQFEPHIVQSKKDSRKLFCHLTKKQLNKVPEEVQLHVNGRRFKLRKEEREERDAMRASRKKKLHTSDEEEDPLLAKFKGFDSEESEEGEGEEQEEGEEEEEEEEDEAGKGRRGKLMPSIGPVRDSEHSNDEFEEVAAQGSDDEDVDDDASEGKGKLPWPVPEFKMFGNKERSERKRKQGDKVAKSETESKRHKSAAAENRSGEDDTSSSKHHGRGDRDGKEPGSKHHGRALKAGAVSPGNGGGGAVPQHKSGKKQGANGKRAGRA